MQLRYQISLLVIFIAISINIHANDSKKLNSEEEYFAEIPSVLATTRLAQPKNEAPSSTTVIDRQMIELSGATNIAELLRLVPGMVVGYESAFKSIVSYHGVSTQYSRRMQVLVDGRSVYETGAGELLWEMLPLPLDDIERIEIVRGPSAASHGANAYLGVISITTRNAAAEQGYSIDNHVGSDSYKQHLFRAGRVGKRLDYRVTFEGKKSDGIDDFPDEYNTAQVGFRADYRFSKRSTLNLFLGYGELEGEQTVDFTPPHTLNRRVDYQQIRWRYQSKNYGQFLIQMYRNALRETADWQSPFPIRDQMGNVIGSELLVFDQTAKEERRDLEFQHSFKIGSWQRIVWGGGVRQDIMSDNESFNTTDNYRINLSRAFFNSETRVLQNTILNLGLMVESHEYADIEYSPRIAINQHLSPNYTIRAGFSRAYRNPVLSEEEAELTFKNIQGDPVYTLIQSEGELESETIDSYEFGVMSNFPQRGLMIDYKLYYDELDNLIRSYFDNQGVLRFSNRDAANITGLEIQTNYQITSNTRLFGSYAREEIDSDNVVDNYTDSAPKHKVSLMLMHQIQNRLEGALIYHYHSKMDWLLINDAVKEYHRWDLSVAHKVRVNRFDARIGGTIRGIFKSTADLTPQAAFGPRAFISLKLHFL